MIPYFGNRKKSRAIFRAEVVNDVIVSRRNFPIPRRKFETRFVIESTKFVRASIMSTLAALSAKSALSQYKSISCANDIQGIVMAADAMVINRIERIYNTSRCAFLSAAARFDAMGKSIPVIDPEIPGIFEAIPPGML